MNYSNDNKIWRVGGPLLVYLGINFVVQLVFSIMIFYVQFNEWSIDAAFNGLMYAEQLNASAQMYTLAMTGVSALISIPIFVWLMKKDYEYPINKRHKERSFDCRVHAKKLDIKTIPLLALAGIFATFGVSRLILILPLDGILGDYSQVKATYEAGGVWLQIIALGILSPIVEELLFRGLVYKRLKVYYDTIISAYISAIIFGVAHFNLIQGLYAFVMDIAFSFIYERCKNIYGPIIVHIVANLTTVISGINPISSWIDRHIWIKLPLALVETVLFIKIVYAIYKKTDAKDGDEDESDKEDVNEEIHKIDFSI